MENYFIKIVLEDERLTCEGKLNVLKDKLEKEPKG